MLHPRVPYSRMRDEDSSIERICVSRSIDGCLCALGGFDIDDTINVYRVVEDVITVKPSAEMVADVIFTGEEWITESITINKQFKIKIIDVFSLYS